MPEGPEIRRAADRVAGVLLDRTVVRVRFGVPSLKRFERRLQGHVVTAVDTHGKAMLTRFDVGLTLYSHNQLYGKWFTVRRPRRPDTGRQLRVELSTESHSALLYSATDIEVLDAAGLQQHPFLARLGPDILDRGLTAAGIDARLVGKPFLRRSLASLYLDQRFLAGTGNYLRSEILWAARLDPARRPVDLSPAERRKLAAETLRISRRSYRTGGITVAPALAKSLRAEGQTRDQYRFGIFGRRGLPCHRCGTPVEQSTAASRNLFTCPACQA